MNKNLTDKQDITEVVNRLFIYTDYKEWDKLKALVFAPQVLMDMSSLSGAEADLISADDICDLWNEGFEGLDGIHHQAGHYVINVNENTADAYAYAVATHYKASATKGKTRSFTGSYNIDLVRTDSGWRINGFKYNFKFGDGNLSLE
jgi:hypothetical protein